MTSSLAQVLDAIGLDQSAVDGGLLVGVAGARQVREEVRPVGEGLAVEPGIEFVQDVLSGVQAFRVRPRLQPAGTVASAAQTGMDPGRSLKTRRLRSWAVAKCDELRYAH